MRILETDDTRSNAIVASLCSPGAVGEVKKGGEPLEVPLDGQRCRMLLEKREFLG